MVSDEKENEMASNVIKAHNRGVIDVIVAGLVTS